MAVSLDTQALTPFKTNTRKASVALTALIAGEYVPGTFTQTYAGTFSLNEAILAFRSLMLYDDDAQSGLLTVLFDVAQTKDGDHSLTLTFSKTWDRDLG